MHRSSSPLLRRSGLLVASLCLLAGASSAQKVAFRAVLDGAQEVPSNASPAKGTASVVVDMAADTLTFDITYGGFSTAETGAHIHGFAPPGVNAGVLFALPPGTKKTGVWNYPAASEANILANLTYINIHSSTFPGGEIRGQLVRDPSLVAMTATLDGAQEVPPTGSPAQGSGHVSIDTVANTLAFSITHAGLSAAESAAHIHGPAAPGANAGVKFALPPGFHKTGTWNYPEPDEANILAGLMYVNIHSSAFPNGEIRGQIVPLATNPTSYCSASTTSITGCMALMSGAGKPSASAGSGFVVSASPAPGGNLGIFYYSKSGPAAVPLGSHGGLICANPAGLLRVPAGSSGGTSGACNGAYTLDFNVLVAGGSDPALVAGAQVTMGAWFRDPPNAPDGFGLSNGLRFELLP